MNPYTTQPAYQPDGGIYSNTGNNWRGYDANKFMPPKADTYNPAADIGKSFISGFGTGMMTGNPGAGIIMGLITLVGGLIQGLTRRDPPLSPEQRAYKDMINYYKKVGERMKVVNSYKRTMIPNRAKNIPVKTDWDGVVSTFPYNGGT